MIKKTLWLAAIVAMATTVFMTFVVRESLAFGFDINGKPVTVMGTIQQTVGYSLASGDPYDTKTDFQQFLTQALVELKYSPRYDLDFFGSFKFNADWAYGILNNDSEWEDKGFEGSKDDLYFFSDGRDIINELHLTWSPPSSPFFIRAGKQIVAWGETDGLRLMDQINPQDQRRGFGDVQFENSIIPLWLIRAEYQTPFQTNWLQGMTCQFIFNPNLEFRGTERVVPGPDVFGINAANVDVDLGGSYPYDYAHVGSWDDDLSVPDETFNSDGMEYGFRISSIVYDSLITFNYFYGRDNDVVRKITGAPTVETSAFDGRQIWHFPTEAYYPILKFTGMTFSRDIPFLSFSSLGGVAPVLRAEGMYVFDFTNGSEIQTFEESDEIRWAVGLDWKVKIPFLNRTNYFSISPQYFQRRILDYPSGYSLSDYSGTIRDKNETVTLLVSTSYFHNTIQPLFFLMSDLTNQGSLYKAQVTYAPVPNWKYTLGAMFIDASGHTGINLQPLENKDQLYFTIAYSF